MPMGGDEAARNTVQPSMRRIVPCCASPHRRDAPRYRDTFAPRTQNAHGGAHGARPGGRMEVIVS